MGLEIQVAVDRVLQAASPGERGERREQEPLHGVGRPAEADLAAIAGGDQCAEQRRGLALVVRVPIGAEPPKDENRLFERSAGSTVTRAWTSPSPAFHHLCQVPGATTACSPAPSVRSSPASMKLIRPARTSKCSAQWSCTCSPPGTNPPASTAKSATSRAPPLCSADSTSRAFSPVRGFQTTSPARTRRDYPVVLTTWSACPACTATPGRSSSGPGPRSAR
jgi:hypothetical protein